MGNFKPQKYSDKPHNFNLKVTTPPLPPAKQVVSYNYQNVGNNQGQE